MLKKIRQRFFRNKGVNKPSPDEKAYNISCKLASLLVKKFDFDKVDIVVENPIEINSNSLIYKTLVDLGHLKAIESEILIKQEFFKYTEFKSHFNVSKCERRLITFRLSRKYNQSYEYAYIFATTTEHNDNLYFIEKYQDNIFGHYKEPRYLKELGEFESDSFYAYNLQDNQISYYIEIPLQYENDTLILMNSNKGFFPLYRSYLVTVKIDIDQQRFSKKTEFGLSFGDNVLKKHQCEMTNSNDFSYNLLKILYPFNLTDKELNELSLKREQLVNISNCFLNEFNDHYTVKEMENI